MKKILLALALVATLSVGYAQQVSSRAKAMRMMTYAKSEYMVKDVKVYTDTMTVYSLSEYVIYPFGKWETVEDYITDCQLQWYREIGYKKYFDSMEVSVNTLKRVDDSFIDFYRAINTNRVEILEAKITDQEVTMFNGLHTGMTKQEVFSTYFAKYPKSYTVDINVLKVMSGANEVAQIYTFAGNKLRHIQVRSDYRYY